MKRFTVLSAMAILAITTLSSLIPVVQADTLLPTLTLLQTAPADVTAKPVVRSTWGAIKALYRGETATDQSPEQSTVQKPGVGQYSSSRFPTDQCTWYAASEFDKIAPWPGCNWGGNAGTWVTNASAVGWRTFAYPAYYPHAAGYLGLPPGTIVVWTGGSYGHVAVVRYVFQNGIYIQEKNWPVGSGVSGWRLLYWSDVLNRGSYKFSGYIPPWRK